MMADSRTKRARKTVDYSKFSAGISDDDDDFADTTPPPSKKVKKSQAPKPNVKPKTENRRADVKLKNARKAEQEQQFEQELQLALEMSMTQPVQEPCNTQNSDLEPGGESLTVTADVECNMSGIDKLAPTPKDDSLLIRKQSLGTCEGDDEIEILGQDVIEVEPKSRSGRAVRQTVIKTSTQKWSDDDDDDDDNFTESRSKKKSKSKYVESSDSEESEISLDSPSESEDDWADSDDFSDKHSKKKTAKKPSKAKAAKPEKKAPVKPEIKPVESTTATVKASTTNIVSKKSQPSIPKNPASNIKHTVHSSLKTDTNVSQTTKSSPGVGLKKNIQYGMPRLSGSTGLSAGHRSSPGGSACVSSPSGGLRLGLSKKANIKPLHSSVNIVH